jgi:predicted MPP superfamily phosphohydrolase
MELQLGANWANRHALPVDRGELRVALLSDLHGGASVYRDEIAAVVDRTNALEADVVLIVGDAIDAPVALIGERMKPLRHLRARLGVFFTTGNHDYYYGNVQEWIALFKSFGIRTLVNEKVEIGLGDGGSTAKVCLVGLNDASAWKSGIHRSDSSSIGKCPLSEPIVVLAHNPAAADRIVADARAFNRTVDLILSGHTHAGQYYVIVPFVYWLLPYFYGPYELLGGRGGGETTKLLVSAGTLYQGSPMKMPFMSEIWLLRLRWPSS